MSASRKPTFKSVVVDDECQPFDFDPERGDDGGEILQKPVILCGLDSADPRTRFLRWKSRTQSPEVLPSHDVIRSAGFLVGTIAPDGDPAAFEGDCGSWGNGHVEHPVTIEIQGDAVWSTPWIKNANGVSGVGVMDQAVFPGLAFPDGQKLDGAGIKHSRAGVFGAKEATIFSKKFMSLPLSDTSGSPTFAHFIAPLVVFQQAAKNQYRCHAVTDEDWIRSHRNLTARTRSTPEF